MGWPFCFRASSNINILPTLIVLVNSVNSEIFTKWKFFLSLDTISEFFVVIKMYGTINCVLLLKIQEKLNCKILYQVDFGWQCKNLVVQNRQEFTVGSLLYIILYIYGVTVCAKESVAECLGYTFLAQFYA